MEFNIETFKKLKLTPNQFTLLYALIYEDDALYKISCYGEDLWQLQSLGYIKLDNDNKAILRKKALDLKGTDEVAFELFWSKYHEVTALKKTDLQASLKYWTKLSKLDKQKAFDNIQAYYDSLPIYATGKPIKKARTYLNDRNFNDEFEIKRDKKRSLNKML